MAVVPLICNSVFSIYFNTLVVKSRIEAYILIIKVIKATFSFKALHKTVSLHGSYLTQSV